MQKLEIKKKFSDVMGASSDDFSHSSGGEVWTALRIWVALVRAQTSIAAREQIRLDKDKLTRGEFAVLDALFFKGSMLLSEIQKTIIVSSGGMTYLVDRLEKRRYVERQPSQTDRRAVWVALTPEGEARFREVFPEHAKGLVEPISVLNREEQQMLLDLLKKVGLRTNELQEVALERAAQGV